MKRILVLLLIGGGLLVSSLVIGAYTLSVIAASLGENADPRFITNFKGSVTLDPTKGSRSPFYAKSGERFSVEISHEPPEVPITATIQDSKGRIIASLDMNQTSNQFVAAESGSYDLFVTNIGSRPLNASVGVVTLGIHGEFPRLGAAVSSGILFLSGIIVLTIGGIKYVIERKTLRS